MEKDFTVEEIREIRSEISKEYDHDPKKLLEHYREMEKKYKDRILKDKVLINKSSD